MRGMQHGNQNTRRGWDSHFTIGLSSSIHRLGEEAISGQGYGALGQQKSATAHLDSSYGAPMGRDLPEPLG